MSMVLTKEVLPPRPAPSERDFASADEARDALTEDKQLRAAITRSIWMMVLLTGLATMTARTLETFL